MANYLKTAVIIILEYTYRKLQKKVYSASINANLTVIYLGKFDLRIISFGNPLAD